MYVHVCAASNLKSLPHEASVVSEEMDDVSAGSTDEPEDIERAELLDGVPLTLIDASLADEMGDFGVAIVEALPFSG